MRTQLEELIARHSGGKRSVDQVRKDIDRDKILTANEALEYGLVDNVIGSRKKSLSAAGVTS
jgi:ATP-dependent Clp protease protease subunit